MDGNCDTAQPGFGKNEMYPCFDELVTYGIVKSRNFGFSMCVTYLTLGPKMGVPRGNCPPNFQHVPTCVFLVAGVAITGLAVEGSLPVSLTVDSYQEPNVRSFQKPSQLHATATVHGLKAGQAYSLYRFNSTELLPAAQPFASNAMVLI